jgi:hypothetical protein
MAGEPAPDLETTWIVIARKLEIHGVLRPVDVRRLPPDDKPSTDRSQQPN